MKARIEEEAHKAGRSLNAEIVHRLGLTLGNSPAVVAPQEYALTKESGLGPWLDAVWVTKVEAEIDSLREDFKKFARFNRDQDKD